MQLNGSWIKMLQSKKYKLLYKISTSLNCSLDDLMKLSDEQAEYINCYLKHSSFLKACPGSGKTEVIGIKSAYEIHKWQSENSGIAVVTFTISAARELNNRVRKFGAVSSETFPHFIGTFDSWIHNYILQPFCHYLTGYAGKEGDKSMRLIDVESSAGFLSNYTTNIFKDGQTRPVKVTEYYYDYQNNLQGQDDRIDGFLKSITSANDLANLKTNKKNFIKAGFVTYPDVEWLCTHLLNKYPVLQERLAQRFPAIIIDECQDLSNGQIHILEMLRNKGTNLHFVGDLNQSIYEFRKVNPQDIAGYVSNNGFVIRQLTNNYRSCQSIVDVTEKIIGNQQAIIGYENQLCQYPCILWQYDDQTFSQLPQKFDSFITANGLDKKKSVILARGKTTISGLRTQKDKYGYSKSELLAIAFHCWHKDERSTDDLNNALFYLGRALCLLAYGGQGDARNQYCPEGFEHVEWRILLKKVLNKGKSIYPYIENNQDLTWTKWIPKLKQFMQNIWDEMNGQRVTWDDVSAKFRSPDGKKNELVKQICFQLGIANDFRTTTIHSVKGETLNAVLLVSHNNKQSKGGHFSHWLMEGAYDPEHIRFAYVAMSRPKYALIMATPKLKNAELAKLQNLGFVPQ
jgi:DNA helicase-2/ATP-dependent DNA helicase PcrA